MECLNKTLPSQCFPIKQPFLIGPQVAGCVNLFPPVL